MTPGDRIRHLLRSGEVDHPIFVAVASMVMLPYQDEVLAGIVTKVNAALDDSEAVSVGD